MPAEKEVKYNGMFRNPLGKRAIKKIRCARKGFGMYSKHAKRIVRGAAKMEIGYRTGKSIL